MNPFGNETVGTEVVKKETSLMDVQSQKAIAEIQSQMVIAQRFPRDEKLCCDKIINAFGRPSLCERALYSYSRGGTDVTGLSIRGAEALALGWKNVSYGVTELQRKRDESVCEAYAIDLESNVKIAKKFIVKHYRETRKGNYKIESDRDLTELISNIGARKVRGCLLALLPADVQDMAISTIHETLKNNVDLSKEKIKNMVEAFKVYGVTKEQLEARIQRRLDSVTAQQVIQLSKIYNSIRDGLSSSSDWFEMPTTEKKSKKTGKSKLKDELGLEVENNV